MSGARAVFAGPGARRALVDGARGQVELALSGGAYVSLAPSDWILLAAPGSPHGPLSVAVDGIERLDLRPDAPALVTRDLLLVGDRGVSLERMRVRPTVVVGRASAPARVPLPAAPAAIAPGIAALADARLTDAVRLLAGLGEGLTPAGDDVLAGYAAARVALGVPALLSPVAVGRCSALGLAYLRCAERGELPDVAADLLTAVCHGSVAEARAAIPALRAWGSSSGMALAWGIDAAVIESIERGVGDGRISVGDLRVQGCGDRRFRRAARRLVGGAPV
ncbi:MAG: DUF2877 domain-containing protein [Solirubrobacteraceae bacterium]